MRRTYLSSCSWFTLVGMKVGCSLCRKPGYDCQIQRGGPGPGPSRKVRLLSFSQGGSTWSAHVVGRRWLYRATWKPRRRLLVVTMAEFSSRWVPVSRPDDSECGSSNSDQPGLRVHEMLAKKRAPGYRSRSSGWRPDGPRADARRASGGRTAVGSVDGAL